MVAGLAPAEAKAKKDEGGGRRLKGEKLGHESPSAVQFSLAFVEAEVRRADCGAQKCDAFVASNCPPSRGFGRKDGGKGLGWEVQTHRGVPLEAVIQAFWKPERCGWHRGSRPSRKMAVMSELQSIWLKAFSKSIVKRHRFRRCRVAGAV